MQQEGGTHGNSEAASIFYAEIAGVACKFMRAIKVPLVRLMRTFPVR